MSGMVTWQAEDQVALEGARVLIGQTGFRALGRVVRTGPNGELTASYRLTVNEDRVVERLSVTAATGDRERHLTMNRTEDGYWLLDDGSGSTRSDFGGATDVDLERSPLFNTLPIRRLNLHKEPGDHLIPVLFVSLPSLSVELVDQRYRTVSVGDGDTPAVVNFSSGTFSADLTVDADGIVAHYPGLARRVGAIESVA
ncbi:putative glycolipid-binding domain-containing protein [Pseudonocardia sp. N23]|uniref:putative glycolipid-binding domain-containing protein n=1 Tax=Pseudonocardia sp. N23 TaxID=1987376 RepID=UPI000BFCDEF6|nr:putative glycolipid-binding domain-containing protein [Pseudonocardia sp. N23]